MPKVWAVIRREFIETTRTKTFIFSMFFTPLFMGAMMVVPGLLASRSSQTQTRLAVLDQTGKAFAALSAELERDPNRYVFQEGKLKGQPRFVLVDAGTGDDLERDPNSGVIKSLGSVLHDKGAGALLDVRSGFPQLEDVYIYTKHSGDFEPLRVMGSAINAVAVDLKLSGVTDDGTLAGTLRKRVDLEAVKLDKEGQIAGRTDFGIMYMVSISVVLVFYISNLMSGQTLSRGLLEEKSNRIMEVLASSVTPLQLMTGKIIGQSLVLLTQLAVWTGLGVVVSLRFGGGMPEEAATVMASLTGMNLVYLLGFFILGYFFYAALWTGVGAMCTTEQEAQQLQLPIILLQVVPLVAAIGLVRQPGSTMATVLSMIPFFASMVMMLRIVLETPPLWQILLSMGLLLAGIVVAFWAVSRIFRIGILMTGKRATIPEVLRWLRAS